MANYICIRCGTFRADITAEGFIGLHITKIRKLCRVMKQDPWENREAVAAIRDTFPSLIEAAKDKKLRTNSQRAKAAYETLVKKQEIFEKEII